jgi:hypothetical protein
MIQGRTGDAAELLSKSVELNPMAFNSMKNLREIMTLWNRPDEGLELLRREVKARQSLPRAATQEFWLDPAYLGISLLLKGDFTRAKNALTGLKRLQPDHPNVDQLLMLADELLAKYPPATRPGTAAPATSFSP